MHRTILLGLSALGTAILLAATACGSSSTTPTPTPASSPSPTASPVASPLASGNTGMGDTKVNPDSSYDCGGEAFASDNTTIVAYYTVSGSVAAETTAACGVLKPPTFKNEQNFTLPAADTSAACFYTTSDQGATIRLYSAAGASSAETQALCTPLISGGN